MLRRLNPYCIGWYSLGSCFEPIEQITSVLILIVLDGILWDHPLIAMGNEKLS